MCAANFLFVLALAPGAIISVAMAQSGAHGDGHAQHHDIYKDWQRPDVDGPCCNAVSSDDPNGDCRPTTAYMGGDGRWRARIKPGGVPNTDWAAETAIVRDQGGYLVTGPDLLINGKKARWPLPSFTDTWKKRHDPVHEQPRLWRGSTVLESLMSANAQPDALDASFPTRRILAIVGDKWTTVVLYSLSIREHRRFNELQKQIPDISKKMLVQTLRNLERDGLLERTVYQQVPPKTEYRLTDNGHKLREPIAWLCEWGMKNREFIDAIIKARAEAPQGMR